MNETEKLSHFWGKKTWLQPGFMFARDTFFLLAIAYLARWQIKLKVSRDQLLIDGKTEEAQARGLEVQEKLRHWSAPILVAYAVCFSFLCFDLTMSLAWTWFSTLWGGWQFAIMMQTLMASLLLIMFALKKTPMGQLIGRAQFHDVGKMMHGFTIFFAYLTYAHILTYWYGNVPEETEYFLHRLHGPWLGITIVTPILVFVFPLFALIPKASKWTAAFTVPIASVILFAQWLTYLLVVQPELTNGENWIPWVEVGLFLGMLGLFAMAVFRFGKKHPMIAVADPLLPESLVAGH
jgi:hypothetical protein